MVTFKLLIETKGYTGYSLSKKTGIVLTRIYQLTSDKSSFKNIKTVNAVKISEALGMTVNEVYTYLYDQKSGKDDLK